MKKKRSPPPAGDLVRAQVVADTLGLSVHTIRRWLEDGTLKGIRRRRRWYASRRALEALRTALSGID